MCALYKTDTCETAINRMIHFVPPTTDTHIKRPKIMQAERMTYIYCNEQFSTILTKQIVCQDCQDMWH